MVPAALALWLLALAPHAPAAQTATAAPRPAVASTVDEDLARFVAELTALREGDESVLPALRERAQRIGAAGRPDVPAVAAFYAGLPAEPRRRGLEAEREYEALRREVVAARERPEEWPEIRPGILQRLDALVAEHGAEPDPTPAARAQALAAWILEQRVRADPELDDGERADLLLEAETRAREAISIYASCGLLKPQLEPMWLLARLDEARGESGAARDGFDECVALAKRVSSPEFREKGLRGLVALAEDAGDVDEQRDLLRQAAQEFGVDSRWWIAREWAELLIDDDELGAAARVIASARPTGAPDLADWHLIFGNILLRQGRTAEARAHFDEARRLHGPPSAQASQAVVSIARAEALAGDPRTALEMIHSSQAALRSPHARALAHLTRGQAHAVLGELTEAEQALRSALAEGDSLERRLENTDAQNVFGEVVGLEVVAALADVLSRRGESLEAARAVEERQARRLRKTSAVNLTPKGLQAWAAHADGGLLTWVVGADTTVCIHVAADGTAASATISLRREVLREAVRRVREAAIAGDEDRARMLGTEIAARILPEALRARVAGRARAIVLAHGPLEDLPFDLLPPFDADVMALVLPGLPGAEPGPAPVAGDLARWSVLGDPVDVEAAPRLPGARAEAAEVARMHGGEPVLGVEFDRTALIEALRSGRPLHVATHLVRGCQADSRAGAGLLVTRGVLCDDEIRATAQALPLAVLAACETAGGAYADSKELSSVSNAFLASGTRNLCITLWPVADEAARSWSREFHGALGSGASPSGAALAAREALRARGTSVAEWAAFRFAGRD